MRRVDASAIRDEIARLAPLVPIPQTWNLIGGCSMALQGLKASTKDADAVLVPPSAWGQLVEMLEAAGYAWTDRNEAALGHAPPHLRGTLQAWATIQGPVDWDFFPPTDIFDGLQWSAGFESRSVRLLTKGNLTVRLANPDALFLLKAVTGRWRITPGRDIEDLQTLLARISPDWTFIEAEWKRQLVASRRPETLRRTAQDAMQELAQEGYSVPWRP